MASRHYNSVRPSHSVPTSTAYSSSDDSQAALDTKKRTDVEANNRRLRSAISYLTHQGGSDSRGLYADRVDRIDRGILQLFLAERYSFDAHLYRRVQALVRGVQADAQHGIGNEDEETVTASEGSEDSGWLASSDDSVAEAGNIPIVYRLESPPLVAAGVGFAARVPLAQHAPREPASSSSSTEPTHVSINAAPLDRTKIPVSSSSSSFSSSSPSSSSSYFSRFTQKPQYRALTSTEYGKWNHQEYPTALLFDDEFLMPRIEKWNVGFAPAASECVRNGKVSGDPFMESNKTQHRYNHESEGIYRRPNNHGGLSLLLEAIDKSRDGGDGQSRNNKDQETKDKDKDCKKKANDYPPHIVFKRIEQQPRSRDMFSGISGSKSSLGKTQKQSSKVDSVSQSLVNLPPLSNNESSTRTTIPPITQPYNRKASNQPQQAHSHLHSYPRFSTGMLSTYPQLPNNSFSRRSTHELPRPSNGFVRALERRQYDAVSPSERAAARRIALRSSKASATSPQSLVQQLHMSSYVLPTPPPRVQLYKRPFVVDDSSPVAPVRCHTAPMTAPTPGKRNVGDDDILCVDDAKKPKIADVSVMSVESV